MEATREWWQHATACISEGFCPEHRCCLSPEDDGWCDRCRTWWRIDRATEHVVQDFPCDGMRIELPGAMP